MKDNIERIQLTIDYMEQNLKTEITVQELSRIVGYSYFHYCQLFQNATGMSVKNYLISRKLKHAIYEISNGSKKVDIAMAYGFDTYAGFYKAFYREYGCSPSDYLKSYKPMKPYKINLLQEVKIMLSHKAVKKLLAHWGMENCAVSNVYYQGSEQTSENDFNIGEEYVLKVSAIPGGLQRHIEISNALSESGLKVSMPIPTKDGEIIVRDKEIYCILCHRINGICIDSKTLFQKNDLNNAYQFGKFIGRLHLALEKLDKSLCRENHLYHSIKEWAIPKIQDKMTIPLSLLTEYDTMFGALYEELPKQIIHRNMNLSYVYMDNTEMVGITDFELSEYSVRLFDACYAATGILAENFTNEDHNILNWLPLYQNIIKGYDTVAHLSETEKEIVPYVVLSIQFICVAYFSDKEEYANLATINEQILQKILAWWDKLVIK